MSTKHSVQHDGPPCTNNILQQADEPEANHVAGSSKPPPSRSRSNDSVASAISLTDSEDEAKEVNNQNSFTEFPIPSFVIFRYVLFWAAWAVASCRSGPQAGANFLNS